MSKSKIKTSTIKPIKIPYKLSFSKGINERVIKAISKIKKEPKWMEEFRLQSYNIFKKKRMPNWGPNLSEVEFSKIKYYFEVLKEKVSSWEKIPVEIKKTYDELGIPQAEQKLLAGVSAQLESQVIYKKIKDKLEKKGVIFLDTDTALKKYPVLFKKYFSKLVPVADNKFSALNSAVWSGGTFIYVPKNVKVELPLQAYFLINSPRAGQFERTLIIADEGSFLHYIEGCTAPIYSQFSLHSAVVEVFVKRGARVRYTTVQNWSKNIYNLTTKRAKVGENGIMEWVDANLGSKTTMKYPSCVLFGNGARGEMLSLSYAGSEQHQDVGGKMIHLAPNTSSRIISKSVSKYGGRNSYRGLVFVKSALKNVSSFVSCDAMILDKKSRSDTYPTIKINSSNAKVSHEATLQKIDDERLFYLQSRGISKVNAESLMVNGFIEPVVKEIPLEYAVEMNRLIEMEMSGKVG